MREGRSTTDDRDYEAERLAGVMCWVTRSLLVALCRVNCDQNGE
jgi:hypothetical protein